MEDAIISNEQPKQEQLYQQGRYPSVIDTDDLVFEMGKQIVNHLNHEKLIDRIIKQTEVLQQEKIQLKSIKLQAEQKVVLFEQKVKQFEESNKLYEENNHQLSDELVVVRRNLIDKEREFKQVSGTLNNERETFVIEKNQLIKDQDIKYKELLDKNERDLLMLREKHQIDITMLIKEKDVLNQAKIDLEKENNLKKRKSLKKKRS